MTTQARSMTRRSLAVVMVATVVVGLLSSAGSATTVGKPKPKPAQTPTTTLGKSTPTTTTTVPAPSPSPATRKVVLAGTMNIAPDRGPAGTKVNVTANGLPAATTLRLIWTTSDCKWLITGKQQEEYKGRKCTGLDQVLADVTTDSAGALATSFVAPDGWGFAHDVLLVTTKAPAGQVVNQALFDMAMEASIKPSSGPVGTPVTVTVKSMGVDPLENNRQIIYDNAYTGWISSVTTKGTGTAVIPATGAPGRHLIQVARGAFTMPYLNPDQSPRPDIPVFDLWFTVTDDSPVLPAPIATQAPKNKPNGSTLAGGASIRTDLATTLVGTKVTLEGAGFPANTDVALKWFHPVGNRVTGQGWEEKSVDMPKVKSAENGSFSVTFPIPADVGGSHRIEATAGAVTAATQVTVKPAGLALKPAKGPVGTKFAIHLTGVGWTETSNIYAVVYDNRYIGYVCGFNSQGSVTIPMVATGEPGPHFIDLYPAIYKGVEPSGQQSFRIPQLTYALDHPGEQLPAFHYAFAIIDATM